MDDHEGVELDLLVQLPAALGYAPLLSSEMDDFLGFFPSVGGLVSKENLVAGFLRARESLHRSEAVGDRSTDSVTLPPQQQQQDQESTLDMLRQQRHAAEEEAAALRAELEQLRAENVAATKKLKTADSRAIDKDAEMASLRARFEESAVGLEQLQREHALQKRELQSASETVALLQRDAERIARYDECVFLCCEFFSCVLH